jgi:hypothetical protein
MRLIDVFDGERNTITSPRCGWPIGIYWIGAARILGVEPRRCPFQRSFDLVDDTGLHDKGDMLQQFHIAQRVAFYRDDVSPLARIDCADFL